MGRITALATRYELSTQVLSSKPAERLPAMCGSATLAMLVSSTSMNVASVTVNAMIHGLCFGAQGRACAGGGAASNTCSLIEPSWLELHRGRYRHALPQQVVAVLARIEGDSDGNPLHHFDVISR